ELRVYTFESLEKQKAFDEFMAKAMVPALNRAGVGPVGVFKMLQSDNAKLLTADSPKLWVLLPHKSAESFIMLGNRLAADAEFQKAGEAILNAPQKQAAYQRYESTLMLAFDGCPVVEVPTKASSRVMQLRTYESHNEERAKKKIQMFNEGGEIKIFRRCGMTPVFFGESLVGSKLPNLTYMLGFEDEQAMNKGWGAFGKDPDWKKISGDPEYKDTVCNITNLVLRPGSSSQI
ncbi:MAG TPA: NIPSNAP family protein, partial [Tepidisphaeraceae bacterium]|nr:NIPSNAP family protein [Tepidisphaeraceae bacterium]